MLCLPALLGEQYFPMISLLCTRTLNGAIFGPHSSIVVEMTVVIQTRVNHRRTRPASYTNHNILYYIPPYLATPIRPPLIANWPRQTWTAVVSLPHCRTCIEVGRLKEEASEGGKLHEQTPPPYGTRVVKHEGSVVPHASVRLSQMPGICPIQSVFRMWLLLRGRLGGG